MKHFEVHLVETPTDLELAHTAGLLEGEGAPFFITCDLCEDLILLASAPGHRGGGYILVAEESQAISCNSCVRFAISDLGEYNKI